MIISSAKRSDRVDMVLVRMKRMIRPDKVPSEKRSCCSLALAKEDIRGELCGEMTRFDEGDVFSGWPCHLGAGELEYTIEFT